jgi:ribonuclease E
MSENQSTDHWELLASELGTEPPARELDQQSGPRHEGQAPSVGPPEPSSELPQYAPPPKQKRDPADWGAIASALGIMTAPEAGEPALTAGPGDEASEEAARTADFIEEARQEFEAGDEEEESEEEEQQGVDTPDQPAETAWGVGEQEVNGGFGAGLEPWGARPATQTSEGGEPIDDEAPSVADVEAAEDRAPEDEADVESSDKAPARRRRRRRRKPKLGETVDEGTTEPEEAKSVETLVDATVGERVDAETLGPEEMEREDKDEGEARPKRRRKRRTSKRRKKGEGEAGTEAANVHPSDTTEAPETDEDEDEDAEDESGLDGARDTSRRGEGQRPSHRAIPTWGEAIGLIVDGNIERRKKSGGGQARGRGRGRGRTGRSSSEGKASSDR